jgi:tetratricopeptide (TPR) repeat protein
MGLFAAAALAREGGSVQCCVSVDPEFPPATTYGSTMYRSDDPRNVYQPYQPMPLDVSAPPEVILQQLWLTENQVGAYSAALVPDLRNLGAALFADEQYRDAVDTFDRAVHLLRVNEGLYTHSQTGMVEQIISANIAMGDYIAADDKQQYLFRVQRANLAPSSPELLAAVETYADWHRAAYLGQLDKYRFPRVVKLFDLYMETADAIEEEKGGLSREMLPYLQGKLKTEYLLSVYPGEREEGLQVEAGQRDDMELPDLTRLRFWKFEDNNYSNGIKSVRTMREILETDPNSRPEEIADAMVKLGDWYQWYRRFALAIRTYEEAWTFMEDKPGGKEWIAATFSRPLELPSEVVFQPGLMPLRLYNDAQVHARFNVSRHGKAIDIEILSPSSEDNQPAVTRGFKYLRDMRFRPQLDNGEVARSEEVERIYSIRY